MSCSLRQPLGLLQRRQRIAAGEDEIADAGGAQRGFLFAGPPCQIDMLGAGGLKGLCGRGRLPGIDLVGRAQAGQRRAGGLERRGQRRRIGKPFGIDRLDAAGLEEALGKGGARGEIGGRAEIGEKDFWPRAPVLQDFDPTCRASASNGAASRIGGSASNLNFASP